MTAILQQLRQKLSHQRKILQALSSQPFSISKTVPAPGVQRLFSNPVGEGTLIEWLAEEGAGGASVAFQLVQIALRQQAALLVVIDPDGTFSPISLSAVFAMEQILVIRPRRNQVVWAFEQVLRSSARSLIMGPLDHIQPSAYRRLKLAAEHGGSVGMFLRGPKYRREPSWADYRVLVSPRPGPTDERLSRFVQAELIYARGQNISQQQLQMRIDDESGVVHMDSELDRAAALEQTA